MYGKGGYGKIQHDYTAGDLGTYAIPAQKTQDFCDFSIISCFLM